MEMVSIGAMTHKVQELKDLMGRQPIYRKLGHIEGGISKLLVYGYQQMHEAQIKIGGIRQSLKDFERHQKGRKEFARKNCHLERSEIKEVANDLRMRYKSIAPLKETDDFDDA